MPEVELSAGTIEYQDTGGDGPVLVFLPGLTMDGSLWRKVVPGLAPDYRCMLPTLPLGGHRRPMRPGSPRTSPSSSSAPSATSFPRPARTPPLPTNAPIPPAPRADRGR
jgi:pimeloyl-ACP methyl ester carboxylesterase